MDADRDAVPDDVGALKEALAVERAKGLEIAAELAVRAGPGCLNRISASISGASARVKPPCGLAAS
jgi:hypothetical protein